MTLMEIIQKKQIQKKYKRIGKAVNIGKSVGRGSVRYAEHWMGPMEPKPKPKRNYAMATYKQSKEFKQAKRRIDAYYKAKKKGLTEKRSRRIAMLTK